MHRLTVQAIIQVPVDKAWDYWNDPAHVTRWNFATSDWCCPEARNALQPGGEFHYTMAAVDGSAQFDFWGTYQHIEPFQRIDIIIGDGRAMTVLFEAKDGNTVVTEHFEPENENPEELQQAGWQMILDNFKQYAEKVITGAILL